MIAKSHGKEQFKTNTAYHYIYRPRELEDLSAYMFYMEFKVRQYSKAIKEWGDPNGCYLFLEEHPASKYEYVRKHDFPVTADFWFFDFGDVAQFGNIYDVLDPQWNAASFMLRERYAFNVLLLFMPFQTLDQLQKNVFLLTNCDGQLKPIS